MSADPPGITPEPDRGPETAAKSDTAAKPRLHERPLLNLIHKLLGIAGSGATIITFIIVIFVGMFLYGNWPKNSLGSDAAAGATTTQQAPSTPASSTQAPPSLPESTTDIPIQQVVAVGDCLDSDLTQQSCNKAHLYEVVSLRNSDCFSSAVAYSGGDVNLDATSLDSMVKATGDATEICLLTDTSREPFDIWMKDVLATPSGDKYRRCVYSDRNVLDVPCSELHTGEYLSPGDDPSDQATCDAAAEHYLGVGIDRFADSLKVGPLRFEDSAEKQPRCLITVRGDNTLTASIRDIRTRALPMRPGG